MAAIVHWTIKLINAIDVNLKQLILLDNAILVED